VQSSEESIPRSPLREAYERARSLDLAGQIRECIDLLENPDLLVADIVETFRQIDDRFASGELVPADLARAGEALREGQDEPEWYYEGRDLSVLGGCSFTCLSSGVEPLPRTKGEGECQGFDYVGLSCDASLGPVLGAVQSDLDNTAYLLLLRGLAGLAEMAPVAQIERMNRQYFKGALRTSPSFDLNLVTWEYTEGEERTPICQFTRDLSELVKKAIAQRSVFPRALRNIVCLRMNPLRFDGRMCFDWRV
jgi:hypothetical protein